MEKEFLRELEESLYIHRPLPLHRERELEARFVKKKVLGSRPICKEPRTIRAPLRSDHWPEGASTDGDYCIFGTAKLTFPLQSEDWRPFNRLRFQVKPHILGARILHLNVSVRNCGDVPIPDPYFREGSTVFDLENGQWNDCVWEFAAMPRDAVCELSFYVFCSGHDVSAGEELAYTFQDIMLELVDQPEHEHGWVNPNPGIRLSTVGYCPQGAKTAIATTAAQEFHLVDTETGNPVYTGPVRQVENGRGRFAAPSRTPLKSRSGNMLCGCMGSI